MDIALSEYAPHPFNHGPGKSKLVDVKSNDRKYLEKILKEYWDLSPNEIKAFDRNEAYSRVFKILTDQDSYIISSSEINNVENQEFNEHCIQFARKSGIPTIEVQSAKSGSLHVNIQNKVWSLSRYIEGDHFSGSLTQLESSARMLAKFHQSFEKYNLGAEVKNRSYQFSWKRLENIEKLNKLDPTEASETITHLIKVIKDKKQLEAQLNLNYPEQACHNDWHPHNILFDSTDKVAAVLDFDLFDRGKRAYDLALGMHKFSRIFGEQTESKEDIGNTLSRRCTKFITAYQEVNPLLPEELKALKAFIYDGVRKKVLYIVERHYIHGESSSLFDLDKQLVQLLELDIIDDFK